MNRRQAGWGLLSGLLLAGLVAFWLTRGPERHAEAVSQAPADRASRPTQPVAVPPVRNEASPRPRATPVQPARLVPATRTEEAAARLGAFEGRVISATTGEGVEGAELTFASEAGASSARTDAQGRFRFEPHEPGTWQLAMVTARGYLPFGPEWGQSPIRLTASPGQRVSEILLALTPQVELLGKVEEPDGQPVSGARVRVLTGRTGESVLFPTREHYTSDERGEFRFHAPEGATVEARHAGHAPARAEVTPSVALSRRLVLRLGRRDTSAPIANQHLAGRVVDGSALPVAGALVSVRSASSAWPRVYGDSHGYEAVTDAEGRFSVEGLEPGAYDVTARRLGLAPDVLREVAAGREDLVLTLSEGARLTGTVREAATGAPLPSFTLAVDTKRGPLQREAFAQLSFIDARGRYELAGGPPGEYVVHVAAHGYAPSEATVHVREGDSGPVTADFA
ncbi:MAG TPA: carboxypeptidase-like regulatory domain-containing protein, partial [Myxococcaceae bacterium]|nr:carboxypeptidase-like regulatory domain-containing protein [Myxococcaceae bacterium]